MDDRAKMIERLRRAKGLATPSSSPEPTPEPPVLHDDTRQAIEDVTSQVKQVSEQATHALKDASEQATHALKDASEQATHAVKQGVARAKEKMKSLPKVGMPSVSVPKVSLPRPSKKQALIIGVGLVVTGVVAFALTREPSTLIDKESVQTPKAAPVSSKPEIQPTRVSSPDVAPVVVPQVEEKVDDTDVVKVEEPTTPAPEVQPDTEVKPEVAEAKATTPAKATQGGGASKGQSATGNKDRTQASKPKPQTKPQPKPESNWQDKANEDIDAWGEGL